MDGYVLRAEGIQVSPEIRNELLRSTNHIQYLAEVTIKLTAQTKQSRQPHYVYEMYPPKSSHALEWELGYAPGWVVLGDTDLQIARS